MALMNKSNTASSWVIQLVNNAIVSYDSLETAESHYWSCFPVNGKWLSRHVTSSEQSFTDQSRLRRARPNGSLRQFPVLGQMTSDVARGLLFLCHSF